MPLERFMVHSGQKTVKFDDREYDILKPFTVFEKTQITQWGVSSTSGTRWIWRTEALGNDGAVYYSLGTLESDLRRLSYIRRKPATLVPTYVDMQVLEGGYWIAPIGTPRGSSPAWLPIGIGTFTREGKNITVKLADGKTALVRTLYDNAGKAINYHTTNTMIKAMDHIHWSTPSTQGDAPMKASEALKSQMTAIAEMIAAAEEKEKALDLALSREPASDDPDTMPVIYWEETFREGGPKYTYVAVKLSDSWYTTQRKTGKQGVYNWAGLVDEFHAIRHGEFWMAAKWVHA